MIPNFLSRGRCAETDPEVFFPDKGGDIKTPFAVCGGCEVQPECLAYAVERPELLGIWGGTGARQRQQIRNAQGHHDGTLDPATDHDAA